MFFDVMRRAKQGASYQVKDLLFQKLASRSWPSVANMLANPLEIRGSHRVTNMNPEATLETNGWGNSMIEASTDCLGRNRAS